LSKETSQPAQPESCKTANLGSCFESFSIEAPIPQKKPNYTQILSFYPQVIHIGFI